MPSVRQLVGPPGTGKTHQLMQDMDDLLRQDVKPSEIGIISFTRAAIHEVWYRAAKQFSLDLRPKFGGKAGTIHALCYHGLGKVNLFSRNDWRDFCKSQNLAFTDTMHPDSEDSLYDTWEPVGRKEGDVIRAWYDWARNCLIPLDVAARQYDPGYGTGWNPSRALRIAARYEEAKKELGKPDFCDLLLLALKRGLNINVKVLMVDEAQDLSPLQQRVVSMWAEDADDVRYYYDPDQCIYQWQGADPQWLLDMDAERRFLTKSHRVPRAIARLANHYISHNRKRFPHTFEPTAAEGAVRRYWSLADLMTAVAEGKDKAWGLLARNRFLLAEYTDRLLDAGIPFVNLRGPSPLEKIPDAIIAALTLARGDAISLKQLHHLAEQTSTAECWNRGAKAKLKRLQAEDPDGKVILADLYSLGAKVRLVNALSRKETALDLLTGISLERRLYYHLVVNNCGISALTEEPRVTIGTIHAVKGAEFDCVALLPDMAARTVDAAEDDPEAERRVWYVGITRAKEQLILLEPLTRKYNDELI